MKMLTVCIYILLLFILFHICTKGNFVMKRKRVEDAMFQLLNTLGIYVV